MGNRSQKFFFLKKIPSIYSNFYISSFILIKSVLNVKAYFNFVFVKFILRNEKNLNLYEKSEVTT